MHMADPGEHEYESEEQAEGEPQFQSEYEDRHEGLSRGRTSR
jgi:hypothetical protein